MLVILIDDVGFGASAPSAVRARHRTREAGGEWPEVQPISHHGAVLAHPAGAADRPQPSFGGHGRHHRDRDRRPGYSSVLPNTKAPLAVTLKLNGYSTAQFGKCHEVPVWQTSPVGPFDAWPTGGGGFEYFYGFIGGETNQWYPALYEGTTPIEPPKTPEEGYHFTEDMTDKAIDWMRQQKALMPDKPFFVYFAPGATHAPHHVPKEWIDKYKGKFDQAGTSSAKRPSSGRRNWASFRRMRADPAPRRDPGLGRHAGRAQAGARARDGGVRRVPGAHRPSRRPAARCARRTRTSWTTRWSTSSSATTAPRPRARCRAPSTRWPTSTAWPQSRPPSS